MTGTEPRGEVTARGGGLIAYLDSILAPRGGTLDHSQVAAVDRLQQLSDELVAFRVARQPRLKRLFRPPEVPRGVYLHGGVGRGKSFVMDSFFATVAVKRKTRTHFHAFMRDMHEEMNTLKDETDPLATVAARVARKWRLVCFDEFHVADIADAMILSRLLSALLTAGVVFVMTSNYRHDELYPNGLQRQKFMPTIRLLEQWLDLVEIDAGVDYRLRALEQVEAYHTPPGDEADAALARAFERIRIGPDEDPRLSILGRTLVARRSAGSAIWFDFATLCGGPRSQRDYLELAEQFSVLLLSDVPRMTVDMGDIARRFTWLVDILYEHRVKVLMSAEAPPHELYRAGPNSQDFHRTASRLIEMRTREYMALAHVSGKGDGA